MLAKEIFEALAKVIHLEVYGVNGWVFVDSLSGLPKIHLDLLEECYSTVRVATNVLGEPCFHSFLTTRV